MIRVKARKLTVGSLKEGISKIEVSQELTKELTEELIKKELEVKNDKFQFKVFQNNKYLFVEPRKGTTLLEAAINQGQLLEYKCKKGTCGKCTIKVEKGSECLEKPTTQEQKKLGANLNSDYRLACQSIITCD